MLPTIPMKSLWIFSLTLVFSIIKFSEADCSSALGMTSRAIKDHQIKASSVFSPYNKAETARLRNHWVAKPLSFGGWCAAESDNFPYLQIKFQRETVVQSLATQGLNYPSGNWVSEYAVNYSCDGYRWTVYTEGGKQKVFKGNNDDSTIKRQDLKRPIIAKLIRFIPLKKSGVACMRVEMYGCESKQDNQFSDCSIPVGMEDTRIESHQVTASSYSQNHLPAYARLNLKQKIVNGNVTWGAWCTSQVNQQQYLQIDLGTIRTISAVATQGYVTLGWVTKYKINYSLDEQDWYTYKDIKNKTAKIFDGSWDADTISKQHLETKIQARFVRFLPTGWKTPGSICMRVEVYECIYYKGCPPIETTLAPTGSQTSHMSSSFRPTKGPTDPRPTVASNDVEQQVNSLASLANVGQLVMFICFICSFLLC